MTTKANDFKHKNMLSKKFNPYIVDIVRGYNAPLLDEQRRRKESVLSDMNGVFNDETEWAQVSMFNEYTVYTPTGVERMDKGALLRGYVRQVVWSR